VESRPSALDRERAYWASATASNAILPDKPRLGAILTGKLIYGGKNMRNLLRSDFGKLWTALSISLIGSEITALALPLIAARTLGASAFEMGVLAGVGQAPFLLFSLPAGAWVDRLPRRPILIATDVGSALLLLSIPIASIFGGPVYLQLCAVAFGVGTFTVVSEVAHYAYVPTLVGRNHLTRFNSRLQVSHSAAAAGGPGMAGVLIQLLTAPIAVPPTPSRSSSPPFSSARSATPSRPSTQKPGRPA
jgi:MFS family permease